MPAEVRVTWSPLSQGLSEVALCAARRLIFSKTPIHYWQTLEAWLQANSSEFIRVYFTLGAQSGFRHTLENTLDSVSGLCSWAGGNVKRPWPIKNKFSGSQFLTVQIKKENELNKSLHYANPLCISSVWATYIKHNRPHTSDHCYLTVRLRWWGQEVLMQVSHKGFSWLRFCTIS